VCVRNVAITCAAWETLPLLYFFLWCLPEEAVRAEDAPAAF
jgi:hypothetical protein